MAATTQLSERDLFLQRAEQEFLQKQELERREQQKRREFASKVLVSPRYPSLAPAHNAGKYEEIADSLRSGEIEGLVPLRNDYGQGMSSLVFSPNIPKKGLGGFVLELDPQARVNISNLMDQRAPFRHTMIVHLHPGENDLSQIDDPEKMATMREQVHEYLSSLPSDGPSVNTHFSISSPYRDLHEWPIFFPRQKSKIGYYKNGGNHFIIATVHAGKTAMKDLLHICKEELITAHSFVCDKRVQWLKNMAARNCARLIHAVASLIGFLVPCKKDYRAWCEPHIELPSLATPYLEITSNTVGMSRGLRETPLFFCKTADAIHAKSLIVQMGKAGIVSVVNYSPMMHKHTRVSPISSHKHSHHSKSFEKRQKKHRHRFHSMKKEENLHLRAYERYTHQTFPGVYGMMGISSDASIDEYKPVQIFLP